MNTQGARRLLTFRLDQEQRQRLRARLAREGRTMSEVVTNGLRQYVDNVLARGGSASPGGRPPGDPPHGGLPAPRTPRAPPDCRTGLPRGCASCAPPGAANCFPGHWRR